MESAYFVQYLLKFFLVLILLSGLGKLIFPQRASYPFYNLFFNTFFSAILVTSGFAIWKTGGTTVMIGFILWLCVWLYLHRKDTFFYILKWRSQTYLSLPILIRTSILILGLIGIFCWAYFARVQSGVFPFIIPEGTALAPNDLHVYALRSYFIAETGQENYFGVYNSFAEEYHGPKPYHYLELWFNASVQALLGGLNVLNLSLITAPVFQAIALFGILALWEHYRPPCWQHVLVSIGFLWLAGFYMFYNKIGFPSFSLPIMTYRFKMISYYPFLIGFAVCGLHQEWKKSVLLLLGLPLATIVAAPAILGAIVLFGLGYWIFAKQPQLPLKDWMIYTVLVFSFLGLFYGINGSGTSGTTFEVGQSEIIQGFHLGKILGQFLYAMVHLALLYAPFALLYYLFRPYLIIQVEKHQFLLWIGLSIIVAGASVWSLMYRFAQSSQLFYNLAIPTANILGMVLIILIAKEYRLYIFNKKSWPVLGIVGLIIGLQFYQVGKVQFENRGKTNYSTAYLQQIDQLVQTGQLSPIGGALKGGDDYKSEYSKMVAGYTLGYYLQYMNNAYATVSLSDFDIPINDKDKRNNLKDIQSGAFYRFVESQKAAGDFVSVPQSQVDFLQKHQMNFVIVSANAYLPASFESKIKTEIRDSTSGERFILLKKI